jgi:hypothetical protein
MNRIAQHRVLVCGDSFAACSDQVRRFFDLTSLVIYDCIEVRQEQSRAAVAADFGGAVEAAIADNRETVDGLIAELGRTGIGSIDGLPGLPQGYPSKILHIIAHFLDGFIGIDSSFYNLVDDSHWLPESTRAAIVRHPENYWLIHVDCYSATPEEAALLHL